MAADLLVSIFSSAISTEFFTPKPPGVDPKEAFAIMQNLPSMEEILQLAHNDHELSAVISPEAFALLRWILLSNRSHLIHLPAEMQFKDLNPSVQFMTLLSAPEVEEVFNSLKMKYGSFYLWHGSNGQRWHSILRNGLKNATGTSMQANGAAFGPGIYFARDSQMSWQYSHKSPNGYARSRLGKLLHIIALCEVAKIPPVGRPLPVAPNQGKRAKLHGLKGSLTDFGWAYTLTLESACIVRFMMVGGDFSRDVVARPLDRVPTLHDVLEFHAHQAH
jgi:poly [ADP-ribose] polymerase 6/8